VNIVKQIDEKINKELGIQFTNYTLNALMNSFYGLNGKEALTKCVQLVEIIHEAFFQCLKESAIEIGQKLANSRKLFKLPIITINKIDEDDEEPPIKKSGQTKHLNKEDILKKVKNDLRKDLIKIKKDSDLKFLLDENLNNFLLDTDEQISPQILASLKMIENKYKELNEFSKKNVYFDLSKCYSSSDMNNNKKNYLDANIKLDSKNIKLESFLKLKKLVENLELYEKYENFHGFQPENQWINKNDLEEILSEKREFYINKNKITTRNLFINFDAHKLEFIFNSKFSIKCDTITSSLLSSKIDENGFFVPDELVYMFKSLSTNLVELDEENFDFMVFNTDMCWFVLFTNTKEDYDKWHPYLFKAYSFF